MKLPILLTFYKREEVYKVLESIKKYKPNKLYISSDGPKSINKGEAELIEDIRSSLMQKIDWECKVIAKMNKLNLGCRQSVHEAIQWFFSHEEMGIILEDDVIPSDYFYEYCEIGLEMYKNDFRIGTITGRNNLNVYGTSDVFLTNNFSSWGWASWRDRVIDIDLSKFEFDIENLVYKSDVSYLELCHIKGINGLLHRKYVDSWAYSYYLYFLSKKLMHLTPRYNMIKNIGYGESGTHSRTFKKDDVELFEIALSIKYTPKIDTKYMQENILKAYGGSAGAYLFQYSQYLILPIIMLSKLKIFCRLMLGK